METALWILVGVLMLTGLIGSVVPLLPGTTLILAAVLLQKWLLAATLSWTAVAWIAAFWLCSVASDFACTLLGARLLGGSKWGLAGASGGALAGMFISLPALLAGTFLGAVAAEKWGAKRPDREALKSGTGAAIGFLVSTVVRAACAFAMVAIYVIAVWPTAAPAE